MTNSILTINTGSSSLKAALYRAGPPETLAFAVNVERIGQSGSRLRISNDQGVTLFERNEDLASHAAALHALFDWLGTEGHGQSLAAIGHRVVHGGSHYTVPRLIDAEVIQGLRELVTIDPDHLPQAITGIEAAEERYPAVPQVACFDTTFHRQMPRVAQIYPLPSDLGEAGLIRYGFHGLSYESIMDKLRREAPVAADGRVIIAHLGNGASMAAVRTGVGIDTTMGFTPTGGLVMGTRSGDLDPGVLLYLLQSRGMSPAALNKLVNHQAGLIGVSGTSADMRDLLGREATDPRAALAVDLFCYQARKFLGALTAALGGLDTLIFTAGIGEHAAPVRQRICADLEFLGIQLDPARNAAHRPIISRENSSVVVRVMKTDEDLMIARHTRHLVLEQGGSSVSV